MIRVGLDIGGTKIDAVAVDDHGRIAARTRMNSGFGPVGVVNSAESAVLRLSRLTHTAARDFRSIGIGIPGMIDRSSGRVEFAVNLGIEKVELGRDLARRLHADVFVENDVRAAALGASHLLQPEGTTAYVNVGSGLAAAIVSDGRLWTGASGIASEIGHLPIDPAGVLCGCGQRGCLETVASGFGVARQWHSGDPLPVRSLFEASDAGDSDAARIRSSLAEGIASAVRTLVLTVDAGTVLLGGGVSRIGERLLTDVREVLLTWSDQAPFLRSLSLHRRVRLVEEDLPIAAVGAALIASPREPSAELRPSLAPLG
ncbi:ROK family protein [Leifsonia sp. 22587]|uniref:ROK family protein n=1 Tax=Leifsonia sp. 22587 TaxID=3453946 RepID=UPI003F8682F8